MILREELVAKRKRRRKSVPKDKKTRIPKKYLGGTTGSRRAQLAAVLKRISALYKAGKKVPRSLIQRRIALGRRKRARKKS
tara:strand:+ start:89 stop:331 length:243 start_codon:yes stop_codon:yes gene_type:complete